MTRCAVSIMVVLLFCLLPACAGADDDALVKNGVTPPAVWTFPPREPLRVLAVRGLWYNLYGIDRGLARTGSRVLVDESWHSPDDMRYYPESYEALMPHHLVIIGNVNGNAFGPARRKMLKDYLEHSGAILFLGGKFAYGKEYHGTAFEEIAPVTFMKENDLVSTVAGLPLTAGPASLGNGFTQLDWTAAPRVFWYHTVTPKAGAKVLLTAGGQPLLIAGTYGKGRVAVFTGSVMGDPPAKALPFWRWRDWPIVLADTITWLTEPSRTSDSAQPDAYAKALAAAITAAGGKTAAEQDVFTTYARCCADRASARALLDVVVKSADDISDDTLYALSEQVRPYIDADCAPLGEALVTSGQTHKVSLGLQVLGQSKVPAAKAILEAALKTGDVAVEEDLLTVPGGTDEDIPYRNYLIRLGAVIGLGNLGDPGELRLLREYLLKAQRLRPKLDPLATTLPYEEELYQEAALAALRCGDAEAAEQAVDAFLQIRYLFIRMKVTLDAPLLDPDNERLVLAKKRIAQTIKRQYLRIGQWHGKLSTVPDNVLPALAQRLAREQDPWFSANIALPAFAGRPLTPEVQAALKTSQQYGIAELSQP